MVTGLGETALGVGCLSGLSVTGFKGGSASFVGLPVNGFTAGFAEGRFVAGSFVSLSHQTRVRIPGKSVSVISSTVPPVPK